MNGTISSSINHSLKKLDQLPVVVEVLINPVGLIGGAGGQDVLLCLWGTHVEPHHLAVRTSPMLLGELGVIFTWSFSLSRACLRFKLYR